MKQHLTELLSFAAGTCYGEYYGSTLAALTARSRLSLKAIVKYTEQTFSHIRRALAGLIQQNLVLHYTDDNGNTVYEPNWDNLYNLTMRSGTLINLVEERYDEKVADVFATILRGGATRVGDLVNACTLEPSQHETSQKGDTNGVTNGNANGNTNGVTNSDTGGESDGDNNGSARTNGIQRPQDHHSQKKGHAETVKELYATLHLLLRAGLVIPVNTRLFWPAHDIHLEAERYVKDAKFPAGASTKKERDALAKEVAEVKDGWRDEHYIYVADAKSFKRKRAHSLGAEEEDWHPAKRQRANGLLANGTNGNVGMGVNLQGPLDNDLVISVNFEMCNVGLRDQQFVTMAARHIGETTSKVYEALLRVLEGKMVRCYDSAEATTLAEPSEDPGLSASIKTYAIAQMLDAKVNLDDGLVDETEINGINGHARHSTPDTNGDNAGDNLNSTARTQKPLDAPERLMKIEQHLRILACNFIRFVVADGHEWQVPFSELTRTLIQCEIENHVTARFGMLPARIIRIMNIHGTIDDKLACALTMVGEKQVGLAFNMLFDAGYITLLEIPKDSSRSYERMLLLFTYDVVKARQQLLDDTFKSMTRLLQRAQAEKAKIRGVIEKAERTDVIGKEDKYLNQAEKEALSKFRKIEAYLLRQVLRMDETIALMKDFSPMERPRLLYEKTEKPKGDDDSDG